MFIQPLDNLIRPFLNLSLSLNSYLVLLYLGTTLTIISTTWRDVHHIAYKNKV